MRLPTVDAMMIHTYTAAEPGLFVNSYLVETGEGVILIDSNLLVDDAHALAARLRALRKPLLAAFVTHAHPDHFNGLPFVVPDNVPVYASARVADTIEQIAMPKREQWQPVCGDQWPETYRVPERLDGPVQLADIGVEIRDLGTGESHADSCLLVTADRRVVFTGDVTFGNLHAYTADGHTGPWLDNLDRLAGELDGMTLYPGHGTAGDTALFRQQRQYLLMYREVIRRLADGQPKLTGSQREELERTMQRFLPGAPLTWMIGLGADAVYAELAAA